MYLESVLLLTYLSSLTFFTKLIAMLLMMNMCNAALDYCLILEHLIIFYFGTGFTLGKCKCCLSRKLTRFWIRTTFVVSITTHKRNNNRPTTVFIYLIKYALY